jgi:lipopolysaccharide biosynthesis regulator YciM
MVLPARPVDWPATVGIPPRPAAGFQPRTQAEDIHRHWKHRDGTRGAGPDWAVLITGPPGVGKTQLAASVFQDAVLGVDLRLWVRAETRTLVIAAFAEAADRVQVPVPDDAADDRKAAAFLNWLSTTERTWLVVFDNVSDPAELAGLWPTGPGRVLITTYRQDAALVIGAGVAPVPLGVFTPEEAHAYIDRRIQDATRNGLHTAPDVLDEADGLAWDLGFLPVALAQAVSVILYQVIRCSDYRVDFAHRANRLSELFPERLPADEYERTVATTWSLAMEQANAQIPNGLASRMVQLAAATNPVGAPEAVFLADPSLTFLSATAQPSPAGSEVFTASRTEARSALRTLHALSLIEHQPGSPATVRMHVLTQRAVHESTPASISESAALALADSLNAIWPDQQRDNLTSLLANTEHLIAAFDEVLWNDEAHNVLFAAGLSMLETGMVEAATRHFQWLTEEASSRLGRDNPTTLNARNSLASAYQDAGNLTRATELHKQNLTDSERVLGDNHPATLRARNNLASAYQEAGNLTRAIELFEQNLTALEPVLGNNHPNTLTARNNLASAYFESGNLTRAIELHEQNLTDLEWVLGTNHRETLTARNNLAGAYFESGNLTRAIELLEQNLADSERVLGDNHPATLRARNNLANAYQETGNLTRAIELYEQNLADLEQVLGDNHPHSMTARNNLATAYQDAGNLTRAIEVFEQNLADSERVLGDNHPATLRARNNLASAYQEAGNPTPAIGVQESDPPDGE